MHRRAAKTVLSSQWVTWLVCLCPTLLVVACSGQPRPPLVPSGVVPADAESASPPQQTLRPMPGLLVRPGERQVEFDAVVCLDKGWLEGVVCGRGTREHESLLVSMVPASQIHAALLAAGFQSGAPGSWDVNGEGEHLFLPPTGDRIEVLVRYDKNDDASEPIVESIHHWIRAHGSGDPFPRNPWIFAGSRFIEVPEAFADQMSSYAADMSGSLIGLVTFGDELLANVEVLADRIDVTPQEWEINPDRIPPPKTKVTVILRPWDDTNPRN